MSIIRKLEPKETTLQCCDFNDVCEGEVTHCVTENDRTEIRFYCQEHIDQLREDILKK